jgi:stearoyl-CoA desaturase (delta-9 desaturase)
MSTIPLFPQTYDLKTFRSNEIEKGRLQQQQKALDKKRSSLDWGIPLAQLPVISWNEFQAQASANGAALVAIAGVIHDISPFILDHPGGRALIKSAIGKDATALFNGGVYEHSNAAHNLLSTMRVGILRGGQEVEVWKNESSTLIKDKLGKTVIRAGEQITRVTAPVAAAVAA